MRRPFKRKLVINHNNSKENLPYSSTTTTSVSSVPAQEGILACHDLSPVKLRRFSINLTNTHFTNLSSFGLTGMPVQPKLFQDLGKRLKAWKAPAPDNGKEPSETDCDSNIDNSLTDSGVGVSVAEDSGIYAEIGPPTVKFQAGSTTPQKAQPITKQKTAARSKSLKRSGSSAARKSRDLFRCTSGQRSRSCTPERNVNYRVNPQSMGNAGVDEFSLRRQPPAPPVFRSSQALKDKPRSASFSFRRLSFRKKSRAPDPPSSSQAAPNAYNASTSRARHSVVVRSHPDKDTISRDSGQDSGTDYESVSSGSPDTFAKRCNAVCEKSRNVHKFKGLTEPPDLPTIIRVDHLYGTVRKRDKEQKSKLDKKSSVRNSTTCDYSVLRNAKLVRQDQSEPIPLLPPPRGTVPPSRSGVTLVRVLRLDKFMANKWISGVAVTKKNEYIVVDLRYAYLVDEDGNLKKMVGTKSSNRLQEPIDVAVMPNGNLVLSDHAEQDVKIFNWKGQYLRKVKDKGLPNIAGVATNEKRQILIAGTDKQRISVHSEDDELLYTIPGDNEGKKAHFEHPYSVAVNPLTGDIIVGDDYKQLVTAVSDSGKILWRFCPPGDRNRHFFPSSICVDNDGYVFIADLYNEKVYMLDSSGKYIKTVLSRGEGLKGGPGAVATDGRGHLIVADEEKTLKVFKYGENGFAVNRRSSRFFPEAD